MAFQDFESMTERRRGEKQGKLMKRIAMGTVSAFALVTLIAVAFFVGASKWSDSSDTKPSQSPPQQAANEASHSINKVIKMICNSTDYQDKCENTLNRAVEADPDLSHPKDLLKAAISATADEVNKAMNETTAFKFSTPAEKAAFEDCKVLMQDAKKELGFSVFQVGNTSDVGKLSSTTPDLNNWLSAVMSYQQTCIDGFPKGKLKDGMEKALKAVKEFTSNSLAIVSEVALLLSTFQETGHSRHLLAPSLDKDGYPTWMAHEDRRMLIEAQIQNPKPNVIVAKDGSGNYNTISGALAAMPANYPGRYVIYVKAGVYDETVTVTKVKVTMYGDGSQNTIITGSKNFVDGSRTFESATFVALGDGFLAQSMGFRNTAGPEKDQAVAVRVQGDGAIFVNCRFEGYQDTLYAQTHRQFYRSCEVVGTIDFIFGDASAVFQECSIVVRKPLDNQQNVVTAHGRIDKRETTGIVLQNCRISADNQLVPVKSRIRSYLGRPWKEYARTVVMESTIDDFIHPDGWLAWQGNFALSTLFYAEFNNKGPGANVAARVKWPGHKIINQQEALEYTVGPFLQGDWITATGVPVHFGLYGN